MSPGGVRRSSRIQKEVAILLLGSDTEGREFSEQTKTIVLTRHGAGIVSKHKLAPDQEMILRCLENNREGEARVVGQIGGQPGGYVYGVTFLDPSINLWDQEFPPVTSSEKPASHVLLTCSSCQERELVELNELELDVLAINQGLLRNCKHCRISTIWKRAIGEMDTRPMPTPLEEKPTSPPGTIPATPPKNRRRDFRAKVNFSACVRYSGLEEIVVCENASRGGLCFRSPKRYFLKSTIEIAAPYSPGNPSIFVPAEIVHVHELSEGKLFRYGIAYMKSGKGFREI